MYIAQKQQEDLGAPALGEKKQTTPKKQQKPTSQPATFLWDQRMLFEFLYKKVTQKFNLNFARAEFKSQTQQV